MTYNYFVQLHDVRMMHGAKDANLRLQRVKNLFVQFGFLHSFYRKLSRGREPVSKKDFGERPGPEFPCAQSDVGVDKPLLFLSRRHVGLVFVCYQVGLVFACYQVFPCIFCYQVFLCLRRMPCQKRTVNLQWAQKSLFI